MSEDPEEYEGTVVHSPWKVQLSIKIDGQHLVNIRAESVEEFHQILADMVEKKEPTLIACAALEGSQKPQPARPASALSQAINAAQGGGERELGPIQIENVEVKKGPRDGPPWKSPLYVMKFSDGTSASTFDALNGKAAMGFWTQGHPCFVTIAPSAKNPKYSNLLSIRMAA